MLEKVDATSAARWGKDLDQIKAVGFNTVKCWVDWATAEPRAGEYHFESLDLLMRLASERGLRVIAQIYLDSAPDWVGERYPDSKFVDRSGAVIESQAAPGFCLDHPGVRESVRKFIEALSRQANRSQALYGWDVWSEPHVVNWVRFPYLARPEFCYCPHTQARFREWLEARYGTLDALNAAWYRAFERWDQVTAPRQSTILSYTDYIDWRNFIDDKLANDLKLRVDAVRVADHAHAITSHAATPALFTSPTSGFGQPDDWKMNVNADFWGTSLYPMHSGRLLPLPYQDLAADLDYIWSAGQSYGKGFWIGELQAGQGVTGMRIADPVGSRDLEFWLWQVVSHGAKEIAVYAWYPMNSGYESNGYGLVELDGTVTERAKAAGRVAQTIERYGSEILASRPASAQAAILYDRLSYMVGGEEPSLSQLGQAPRDSMLGLHRAFLERQMPIDFVHTDDVIQGKVDNYKVLFMPYPVMLSQDVAKGIIRYIEQGGTAVAEARLAWNDERGFASDVVPGSGLAEAFGAREKVIRPADKPRLSIDPAAGLPGLTAHEEIPGAAFEEDLAPFAGAKVLARFNNGEPAVVEKSYGKGKTILVGTFAALAAHDPKNGRARDFLVALARAAGVEGEVRVSGPETSEVEVRRLVGENTEFVFLFNHGRNTAHPSLGLRMPWTVDEAKDIVSGKAVPFRASDHSVQFEVTLTGDKVLVLRFARRSP